MLIISTKLELYRLQYPSSSSFHFFSFFLFAFPSRSTLNLKHHIAVRHTRINPERLAKTNSKSLRLSEKFHYFRKVTCCVFLIKQCWIYVWRNYFLTAYRLSIRNFFVLLSFLDTTANKFKDRLIYICGNCNGRLPPKASEIPKLFWNI